MEFKLKAKTKSKRKFRSSKNNAPMNWMTACGAYLNSAAPARVRSSFINMSKMRENHIGASACVRWEVFQNCTWSHRARILFMNLFRFDFERRRLLPLAGVWWNRDRNVRLIYELPAKCNYAWQSDVCAHFSSWNIFGYWVIILACLRCTSLSSERRMRNSSGYWTWHNCVWTITLMWASEWLSGE